MSVTATIEACAREQESCSRRDNSHGHWANCNPSDTGNVPQVQEDCNYYSHMYYRDPNGNNLPPVDTSGNHKTKPDCETDGGKFHNYVWQEEATFQIEVPISGGWSGTCNHNSLYQLIKVCDDPPQQGTNGNKCEVGGFLMKGEDYDQTIQENLWFQ